MPLKIIRQDITKIECDAIINPTNKRLRPTGGVDKAIHKAAGKELSLACKALKSIETGEAKLTSAFNLPCKYVIHTCGPVWKGGKRNEKELLQACYRNAFCLAVENGCESIAFPLISSGEYKYPKEQVLRDAAEVLDELLLEHEMLVYLVVYDKTSFEISKGLFSSVLSYIDSKYVDESADALIREMRSLSSSSDDSVFECRSEAVFEERRLCSRRMELDDIDFCFAADLSLETMLENMDKGFAETLFYYIDKRGISDVECYKRSNVDKKTFSKIKCNKDYKPSKVTAVSFAIGLRLSLEETEHLLKTVGMTLSHSNKFDLIIEYFITTGNYKSIFDVNEVLYQFDQLTLGV